MAMNEFYASRWTQLRQVEGAAQRVQEDTMRFASIMEGLGVSLVDAFMTLVAFLPVLWSLSQYVTELPIIGSIASPLFYAAIFLVYIRYHADGICRHKTAWFRVS